MPTCRSSLRPRATPRRSGDWTTSRSPRIDSATAFPGHRSSGGTGSGTPFVIADATDDRPLGLLNLQFGVDEEVAGLAVSVFPQARGRGVASRALRLGATWGLRELGLCRVFAEAAVDNPASIRAIEKAGFQREGILRAHCKTHGQRHDCVMFSLLPQDIDHPQEFMTWVAARSPDAGLSTCSVAADRRQPRASRADDRRGGGLGDDLDVEGVAP